MDWLVYMFFGGAIIWTGFRMGQLIRAVIRMSGGWF